MKTMEELTSDWLSGRVAGLSIEAVNQLRSVLHFHEHRYYVLHQPLISDQEYDKLFKQLQAVEAEHPEWVVPDSPTQRVGSDLNADFQSVTHMVPMLSLDNSYNSQDLLQWHKRVMELSGNEKPAYCVEPKFDGASISLIYEDDILVRSATRGDGLQGDDITINSKRIRNLPLRASFSSHGIQQIEIRGEVLMNKQVFARLNEINAEKGLPPLANPRNAAAGTLRIKDSREVSRRSLEAFAYHVSFIQETPAYHAKTPPETHSGMLQMLWDCGFRSPVKEMKVCATIDEVIAHCQHYEAIRDELPYEIDGMVIKVNDLALQEQVGATTHHPRWAMAFKFKARQGQSVLRAVDFQVGRTGAITPVAKIDPVAIGGVTVGSISIHNEDYIAEKDLRIGDTVVVERAGDVIPQIVRSLAEKRTGSEQQIIFPGRCPVCSSILYKESDEAVWRCVNAECEAQVVERMIHFVSKDAMDIRSLGEQQVRRFFELGMLKDIPGIYQLDYDKILALEGYKEKSVDNLKIAIEGSKRQPIHRLLYGLGIRHVGETMAKTLARSVRHLLDLRIMTNEQLMQLEDVGPKVAASIQTFFAQPANIEMLQTLENIGLNLKNEEIESNEEGIFSGKTFLFTGTLSTFKRSEAEAKVEASGGSILSGVSSKLNYLIVGEDAGSKLQKAQKIPTIKILSEEEFLKMMTND